MSQDSRQYNGVFWYDRRGVYVGMLGCGDVGICITNGTFFLFVGGEIGIPEILKRLA